MTTLWTNELTASEWDKHLANLNGHPLQSALWGDARAKVDHIPDFRYACLEDDKPVFMARIERRTVPTLGNVAWLARGPVCHEKCQAYLHELQNQIKHHQFGFMVTDPYAVVNTARQYSTQTILLDLTIGEEKLLANLHKQWRYGVRRAEKEGVNIEIGESNLTDFFELCQQVSQTKDFELPGSLELIQFLLANHYNPKARFVLICAKFENKVIAGAVIVQMGQHAHYFWGASDRNYANQRGGEAVQWAAIQWALKNNISQYDLGGIDPVNNPGTYAFKKKMGGKEVLLQGVEYTTFTLTAKLGLKAAKILGKI